MSVQVNVASPKLNRDNRSRELIEHLKELAGRLGGAETLIYYDYPLFRDADDVLYRSKVLFVSQSHGIALFQTADLTDRTCTPDAVSRLDASVAQLHSIIYGKLLKARVLRKSKQELLFPVLSFLVLPDVQRKDLCPADGLESELLFSYGAVDDKVYSAALAQQLPQDAWAELRSILEGAKGLLRPKDRQVPPGQPNSKAAKLRELESEIANFDVEQRRAAITIVDGPQRIRGLAGSGKTIVLAMKAAHIHLSDPDAKILLTFHTKSLYDFIKRLITRFYRQFNDRDPDFEGRVHVLHSWGGRTAPGVYYNAALDAGVPPIAFQEAQSRGGNAFEYVCTQLLKTERVQPKYDYVLIDEAQDLPTSFRELCFRLAKGGDFDRNVVWAYDELQTIMSVKMPSPREAFGVSSDGQPLVDLSRAAAKTGMPDAHDVVLHRCYRNPREVLVCAHALGLGIYSDTMVQTLENKEHWEDVGYLVEEGNCRPGERTIISRPRENSPLSISETQTADELIQSFVASDVDEEVGWVVTSIRDLLSEGLRPDDILVIALDDRNAKPYFAQITEALSELTVVTNNMSASVYGEPHFYVDEELTLSTVYRAKGNEAAVVFVVGIDGVYLERKLQRGRNKIFTAFTRAKGWLRVSGVGDGAQFFVDELNRAKEKLPRLEFTYPDPAKVSQIQRDLTDRAAKLRKLRQQLEGAREQLNLDEEELSALFGALRDNS